MMRTAAMLAAMVLPLLFFACKNSAGSGDDNENVVEIPFETGKYITAKGVSDGIEITISADLELKEDGGNSISVDGVPFIINIKNDDVIRSGVKKYVFPFTKSNETYNVTVSGNTIQKEWFSETVQCVAGGGIDYTKYVNVAPIVNSKLTISYKEPDGSEINKTDDESDDDGYSEPESSFEVTLELDFSKYDTVIKDKSLFEEFDFLLTTLLGKGDWSHTSWHGAVTLKYLEMGNTNNFFFMFYGPEKDYWRNYNYEYVATLSTVIKLNKYPYIEFAIPTIWSEQMKYDPNSGN